MSRKGMPPRVLAARQAARQWSAGQYHAALTTLREAGYNRQEVDAFIREGHARNRQRAIARGVARS